MLNSASAISAALRIDCATAARIAGGRQRQDQRDLHLPGADRRSAARAAADGGEPNAEIVGAGHAGARRDQQRASGSATPRAHDARRAPASDQAARHATLRNATRRHSARSACHIGREGQLSQKLGRNPATQADAAAILGTCSRARARLTRDRRREQAPPLCASPDRQVEAPRAARPAFIWSRRRSGTCATSRCARWRCWPPPTSIACEDTRVTRKLLDHYGIATPLIALSRPQRRNRAAEDPGAARGGGHGRAGLGCRHAADLRSRLQAGARRDRGRPCGHGGAGRLVRADGADRRGAADRPLFLRGVPAAERDRAARRASPSLRAFPATLVLFESGPRLAAALADLAAGARRTRSRGLPRTDQAA